MNRFINKIIVLMVTVMGMIGCYQDKSKMDINKIDDLKIEVISINNFDSDRQLIIIPTSNELKIKVAVTKGANKKPDVSYSWRLTPAPWSMPVLEIGNTEEMTYKVKLPIKATEYYRIFLTVTDNKTSLQYIREWKMLVTGKFAEGLVVAHTADNSTSDISFVSSQMFAENSVEEYVERNIYSNTQGTKINGIITRLLYGANASRAIFGVTDTYELFRVSASDFILDGTGQQLFSSAGLVNTIHAEGLYYATSTCFLLVNNGNIHGSNNGSSYKFPGATNVTKDYSVDGPIVCYTSGLGYKERAVFYDLYAGKIRRMNWPGYPTTGATIVDLYSGVSGYKSVGGGVDFNSKLVLILKNTSTGKYNLYICHNGIENPAPPNGMDEVVVKNIPAGNNIENAKSFFVCDNQPIIYYATTTSIYAYNTQTDLVSLKYSVDSGDEITTMKVFQQSWYQEYRTKQNKKPIAAHNNTMLISTYNSSTGVGKLCAVPITNLGEGNLDKNNQKVFSGFKKITSVSEVGI